MHIPRPDTSEERVETVFDVLVVPQWVPLRMTLLYHQRLQRLPWQRLLERETWYTGVCRSINQSAGWLASYWAFCYLCGREWERGWKSDWVSDIHWWWPRSCFGGNESSCQSQIQCTWRTTPTNLHSQHYSLSLCSNRGNASSEWQLLHVIEKWACGGGRHDAKREERTEDPQIGINPGVGLVLVLS